MAHGRYDAAMLGWCSTVGAAALAIAAQGPPIRVAVELVADRTHVAAGEAFELGARFVIPPEWHIYWRNPGDSGVKTEASIRAPDGFEVGEPRYPGPERFVLPGDVVDFGWRGEAMIVFRVVPPAMLAADAKLEFALDARWLMCREACFLGETSKKLSLRVATEQRPGKPANEKLFDVQRRRLPRAWNSLTGAAHEWRGSRTGIDVLALRVPGADRLDFFPYEDSPLAVVRRILGLEPRAALLTLDLRADGDVASDRRRLRGVLRVERGAERAWYEIDLVQPVGKEKKP